MASPRTRLIVACALVAAVTAAVVVFVRPTPEVEHPEIPNPVLSCDLDGFRYEHHLPTGVETLFVLQDGRPVLVNVLKDHPEKARACRETLMRQKGVTDFAALRARYEETIRRLHALGYL